MDSTDATETLTAEGSAETGSATGCPRCGEPAAAIAPCATSLYYAAELRRCTRCGVRYTDEPEPQLLHACAGCGVPFLAEDLLPHVQQCCVECDDGPGRAEPPDPSLAAASEAEARAALDASWSFVTSPTLGDYLNRTIAGLAALFEGAPETCRVVVVDDERVRSLAFPSGLVLISRGALAALEDEAELVFLLAREVVHASSGDAALRLVRLGLGGVARNPGSAGPRVWAAAVEDLMTLGYGRQREREADRRALQAVVELGYDTQSVRRHLERLERSIAAGDLRVRELAIARTTPADRLRRLRDQLSGGIARSPGKVNREVFRRVAGSDALATELVRVERLEDALASSGPPAAAAPRGLRRGLWTAVGIVVLAALILLVGLLLAD